MVFRPLLYEETACASYLFGCLTRSTLAVVDPDVELAQPADQAAIVAANRSGLSPAHR